MADLIPISFTFNGETRYGKLDPEDAEKGNFERFVSAGATDILVGDEAILQPPPDLNVDRLQEIDERQREINVQSIASMRSILLAMEAAGMLQGLEGSKGSPSPVVADINQLKALGNEINTLQDEISSLGGIKYNI